MKLNLDETIEISEFLKRKNVVLNEKLNDQKEKFEEQLKANFELEQFQKWLNLLKEKFPNYSLEKLINKHELLEQTLTELVKKVAELEETTKKTENEKNNEINIFKNKFVTIQEKEKKREKEVIDLQNQLNFQGKDSNEIHNYKDRFFLIFKKLVNLYNKWNKKIKVYNGLDINFNDPCEIIDFLDKFIQISTPDNIQKYLRKIIVSANSLQREHFKKFINERFDPDKIYERINKKINYLKNKAKLEITSKDNESDSSFLKEAWS